MMNIQHGSQLAFEQVNGVKAPSYYFVTLTPKVFNSFQNAGEGSNIGHSLKLCVVPLVSWMSYSQILWVLIVPASIFITCVSKWSLSYCTNKSCIIVYCAVDQNLASNNICSVDSETNEELFICCLLHLWKQSERSLFSSRLTLETFVSDTDTKCTTSLFIVHLFKLWIAGKVGVVRLCIPDGFDIRKLW